MEHWVKKLYGNVFKYINHGPGRIIFLWNIWFTNSLIHWFTDLHREFVADTVLETKYLEVRRAKIWTHECALTVTQIRGKIKLKQKLHECNSSLFIYLHPFSRWGPKCYSIGPPYLKCTMHLYLYYFLCLMRSVPSSPLLYTYPQWFYRL